MWNEIIYPFPNFSGAAVEVWECRSNSISHFTERVATYPCWDWNQSVLIKGALDILQKAFSETLSRNKTFVFRFNFHEACSFGSNWQRVSTGSGDGLVLFRQIACWPSQYEAVTLVDWYQATPMKFLCEKKMEVHHKDTYSQNPVLMYCYRVVIYDMYRQTSYSFCILLRGFILHKWYYSWPWSFHTTVL